MSQPQVFVERVPEYYENLATDLGKLMPALSEHRIDDGPVAEELVRPAVESPQHEIIVARSVKDGKVVGAANLSKIIAFELKKPEYWLGGFVTSQEMRGQGVGFEIWQEIIEVCREQRANLGWTSNADRKDRAEAIEFYTRQGAKVRPTTVFHLEVE